MKNYYNILEVDEDASQEEIKRAYARKVRIHNPEKDPENFKKIREAYEILSNPEKRKEYDFQITHGEQYEKDIKEVEELIELGLYNDAREKLKRLTLIKPEDERLWIKLSDTYIREKKFNSAIQFLQKGLTYNKESATILFLLGFYHKEIKKYYDAEEYFKKALKIDKDYFIYEQLMLTYILSNRYYYIETFLNEIEKNSSTDYEKIKFNLLSIKAYCAISKSLDEIIEKTKKYENSIINICYKNEETKKFALKLVLEEVEFYNSGESLVGLYICWEIIYKLFPDLDEAKEKYYLLKDILFDSKNTTTSNTTSNINKNTNRNNSTQRQYNNSQTQNTTNKNSFNNSQQSTSTDSSNNSSNDEGCLGCLGWLIVLSILGSLGPVGAVIFFIIVYYYVKNKSK